MVIALYLIISGMSWGKDGSKGISIKVKVGKIWNCKSLMFKMLLNEKFIFKMLFLISKVL